MLVGIGVDLVSINRIAKIYLKYPERFLSRLFNEKEKETFLKGNKSTASLAARFAGKEAVLKALGCGIGPAALKEVEIITRTGSQPQVRLHGEALKQAKIKAVTEIAITMTHEPPFACAFAAAVNSGAECG